MADDKKSGSGRTKSTYRRQISDVAQQRQTDTELQCWIFGLRVKRVNNILAMSGCASCGYIDVHDSVGVSDL